MRGKLYTVIKKFFAEVLLDDLARGKIEIKSLPGNMRKYVISCIILLCIILLATTVLFFYDHFLPRISFTYNNIQYSISYLSISISLLTFILGWAFLLIGGVWSNILLFTVLALNFIFTTGYFSLGIGNPWLILFLFVLIIVLLVFSLKQSQHISAWLRYVFSLFLCYRMSFLSIHLTPLKHHIPIDYIQIYVLGTTAFLFLLTSITSDLSAWRFPQEKFKIIGRLIILIMVIFFLCIFLQFAFRINQFLENFFIIFNHITIYTSLFWFILGFSALWGVINLSEWTKDAIEILFSKKIIFGIVFAFWSLVIFLTLDRLRNPAPYNLTWNIPLLCTSWSIAGAVVLLYKRFTTTRILSLFQITIFVLLFSQAYGAAIGETSKGMEFQWGSLILFIIGIVWLLFQGSGIIINSSGRWFPRNSRLFLFFGLLFLMLGLNNFMLIIKFDTFIKEVGMSAYMGFLYTGPPFILYLWLVKRFKQHPVNPSQLAYLFIWGAVLVHLALVLQKILNIYQIPYIISIAVLSILQEYLKLYVIRKIAYRSSVFNEQIDGIIYASAIGLGWIIFGLNPQFRLIPIKIQFVLDFTPTPPVLSFLGYVFSLQFVCACFLGYYLSKTKLAGISYNRANIFLCRPLFFGWTTAVLYRTIADIITTRYLKQIFSSGLIWGITGISLFITIVIVRKALKTR